jgi:hypothetical protein
VVSALPGCSFLACGPFLLLFISCELENQNAKPVKCVEKRVPRPKPMSLLSHEAKVTYGSNIFFLRGKATRHKHLLWAAYFTNAFSYLNPMIAL